MARRKDMFWVELLAQPGPLAVLHTGVSLAEGMQRAPWVLGLSLLESWVPFSHLAAEPKLQHHHRAWQRWVTAAVRMV